jgi:hypothetical protein
MGWVENGGKQGGVTLEHRFEQWPGTEYSCVPIPTYSAMVSNLLRLWEGVDVAMAIRTQLLLCWVQTIRE